MARNKMCSTTVGVFESRAAAERAVAELKAAGYRDDQIGMVAKNASGKTVRTAGAGETNAEEGAAIGAVAGAAGGALVGAGIAAGVIPVIGPVLAIGTLGTILINAAGGAAVAGLAGALIGWGIPEEDAKYYESEVQAGRYLVTVDCGDRSADVRGLFTRHGGYDRSTARTTTSGDTVQVKEERLRADKQTVNAGEVNVRKEVHTEHQQINVPVEREEVVVERRPASGHATGDVKAEQIHIPVKEEKVNVSKETVAKEEVSVGKRKVQDTKTVTGDVKKEEVVVETEGHAKVRQTGKTDKK
jgi:uncharacterized protein (TIGR02271 family)